MFKLCLHVPQAKWVVRSQAAEEEVHICGMLLAEKMSDKNLEQGINIKFCVKIGKVLVKC
jgi:hypothetical protein